MGKRHEDGGSTTWSTAIEKAQDWVGKDSHYESLKDGGQDVSSDGERSVRLTSHETEGNHIHYCDLKSGESNYVKITSYD